MLALFSSWAPIFSIAVAIGTLLTVWKGATAIELVKKYWVGVWAALTYPFTSTKRRVESIAEAQESFKSDILELKESINLILSEFRPNGGGSLKDQVTRLEKATHITKVKMEIVLEEKGLAMFETDTEGLCKWVSKHYEQLVGRPSSELMDWGWTLTISDEHLEDVRNAWILAISQKRVFEKKYAIVHPSGKKQYIYCRAVPSMLHDTVVGWLGVLTPLP